MSRGDDCSDEEQRGEIKMTISKIIALTLASLLLLGCEGPGKYPVTGEECGPNDPVKDLSAADCFPSGV